MDNFKAIYRILKTLDRYKGDESFDNALISASMLKLPFPAWEQLMIELQRNGYIDGVVIDQSMSDQFPHICEPIHPRITLKGMEYLAENSMMAKDREALRMLGELI